MLICPFVFWFSVQRVREWWEQKGYFLDTWTVIRSANDLWFQFQSFQEKSRTYREMCCHSQEFAITLKFLKIKKKVSNEGEKHSKISICSTLVPTIVGMVFRMGYYRGSDLFRMWFWISIQRVSPVKFKWEVLERFLSPQDVTMGLRMSISAHVSLWFRCKFQLFTSLSESSKV